MIFSDFTMTQKNKINKNTFPYDDDDVLMFYLYVMS